MAKEREDGRPPEIPGFQVDCSFGEDVAVLRIVGRVAPADLSMVEETGRELINKGCRRFAVDLSQAEHVTSTGMGLMLYYRHVLQRSGGGLVLSCPTDNVRRLLENTNLDKVFQVYPGLEEAVAALRKSSSRRSPPEKE
jgi:anti-anti-sigma factor